MAPDLARRMWQVDAYAASRLPCSYAALKYTLKQVRMCRAGRWMHRGELYIHALIDDARPVAACCASPRICAPLHA